MKRRIGAFAVIAALVATTAPPAMAPARGDKDCSDFRNWRQAQNFYKNHRPKKDPHRLDEDRDGIACETLRGAP